MAATAPIVKYLATTSIGEKGQLTVPKEFRDDLQLEAGSPVNVLRIGNGLILIPAQADFDRLCQRISDAFRGAGTSRDEALARLPRIRQEIFEEWYGKPDAKAPRQRQRRRTQP